MGHKARAGNRAGTGGGHAETQPELLDALREIRRRRRGALDRARTVKATLDELAPVLARGILYEKERKLVATLTTARDQLEDELAALDWHLARAEIAAASLLPSGQDRPTRSRSR